MATTSNDSSGWHIGNGGRLSPRADHNPQHPNFQEITVDKRGLNPEVSKVTERPEPPKPLVTKQLAPTSPPPAQ